jgi:hypothetical protein
MGYEPDSDDKAISGKKLAVLFGLALVGALVFIQALFGFPLKDVIRPEVTQAAKVIIKDARGTCIVDTPDHPRSIPNCQFEEGQTLIVTYRQDTEPIVRYQIKQ